MQEFKPNNRSQSIDAPHSPYEPHATTSSSFSSWLPSFLIRDSPQITTEFQVPKPAHLEGYAPRSQSRSQFVKLHGSRENSKTTVPAISNCSWHSLDSVDYQIGPSRFIFDTEKQWIETCHFASRHFWPVLFLVNFVMYQPKWRSAIGRCGKKNGDDA